jgi:hypothetical protein
MFCDAGNVSVCVYGHKTFDSKVQQFNIRPGRKKQQVTHDIGVDTKCVSRQRGIIRKNSSGFWYVPVSKLATSYHNFFGHNKL